MAIEKSAKEVIFNLSRVRVEFDKFGAEFLKIGKNLDNARSNYSQGEKRLIKLTDKLANIEPLNIVEEQAKLKEGE